jgi:hypothetical protein
MTTRATITSTSSSAAPWPLAALGGWSPVPALSLSTQPETSKTILETITQSLKGGALEFPDQPRPGAAAHRPPPGTQLRDIAASLGITDAQRLRHLTRLTTASYVIKPKDGRRNRYQIQAHLPLPEPASQEPAIGEPDQPGATAAEAPSCVTIAESRGFGPSTLQVNGRIYAIVSRGRFVVKLPRARADTLIASRTYLPFDASKGRPMKERVAIAEHAAAQWTKLAAKARQFVS